MLPSPNVDLASRIQETYPDNYEVNGHDGGGGRLDGRLRNVEIQLAEMRAKIDTELGHFATRDELNKMKVWGLSGVFGGMAIAAGIALAVARVF